MSEKQFTVEYREIKGFPGYRVGNDGSVWSCRSRNGVGPLKDTWRPMKLTKDGKGWLVITLHAHGKFQKYVHRIVLEAFVGPCPPEMMCRHFPDPDPTNNRVENLSWGTRKQNAADAILHGAQIRGEQCHRAKLKTAQVEEIRHIHRTTKCSYASLGRRFGIAATNIKKAITRETWSHLP